MENENQSKTQKVSFTLNTGNCPLISYGNEPIPQSNLVKYLGTILDRVRSHGDHRI